MAENRIRFGIMGCAKIAKKVARAINLSPNSTLSAIASRSKEKADQFVTENELDESVKTYGSYEELADDESIDVVYMPLPTSLHVKWAVLAANKKKHLLLEKPPGPDVNELDQILKACELNGVQYMDGSMWAHHPRTCKIEELLSHPKLIGPLEFIHSTCTMPTSEQFLANDIRVKPDMDGLGALGDLGWYCIGAILWSKNYNLPTFVTALPDFTANTAGVLLSCSASLRYDSDNTNAIFHCSFFSHSSMDLKLVGSNGSIYVSDLFIPLNKDSAAFDFTYLAKFVDLHIGWNVKPENIVVANELPQEVLMVQTISEIVRGIKSFGSCPDAKWADISRKTQLVMDAVKKSIDLGCKPVYL